MTLRSIIVLLVLGALVWGYADLAEEFANQPRTNAHIRLQLSGLNQR